MGAVTYKPYDIDTGYLLPPSLADFLGPDDEVHLFREVTEELDVSQLDSGYGGMGQHPYHPRMLLRLLMWGMANRVVSTRRVEVLTRRDVSFVYLAGGQRPDYRTLARFRRRNAAEITRLFEQTVLLCARLGMVKLGHVALDGTKVKANTSRHKAMSYGRMKQEEERLRREIASLMEQAETADEKEDEEFGHDHNGYNLPEELSRREGRLQKIRTLREQLEQEQREEPEIADKEQRSFADPEARIMLMKRGEFDYAYNGHVCVDEAQGVVVAGELSNEAFDGGHLPGLVQKVRDLRREQGLDESDETTQVSADSAYFSAENIQQDGEGIELLLAYGREGKKSGKGEQGRFGVERFDYVKDSDQWTCPDGRVLVRQEKAAAMGRPMLRRYISQDCSGCSLRSRCLRPGEERRSLLVKKRHLLTGEMRARLKEPDKQEVYRKRKWVAEQNIGVIKEGLGFRGFTMRGEAYARAQWFFVLAVHNVMKAVRFLARERAREAVATAPWGKDIGSGAFTANAGSALSVNGAPKYLA